MSESTGIDHCDYRHLRIGIAIALSPRQNFGLEATVLRIIRIALLTLVPMLALGALVTACSDDTTNTTVQDMSMTVKDMTTPVVHDMANPID
jgi:hypothetical protein